MSTNEESKNEKLDLIIQLIAHSIVKDMKDVDAVILLKRLGMDNKNIAVILNTKPNVVRARLAESKLPKSVKRK